MHVMHAPARERLGRRAFLGLPLAVWFLVVATGTALAVVGFVVLLGASGTLSAAGGIDVVYSTNPAHTQVDATMAKGTCAASTTSEELTVTMTDMLPGDTCEVRVGVINNGDVPASVQRFDVKFPGGGVRASLDTPTANYCTHQTILPDGNAYEVGVLFTATNKLVPNASHTMSLANGEGFTFVVQELWDLGLCN